MTPIEKAKWLADFWAQIAAGKTAQEFFQGKWHDISAGELAGPDAGSDLDEWRIKPEPKRMWMGARGGTYDEKEAAKWKAEGLKVTEWLEVI
jgi:hypothetical protein